MSHIFAITIGQDGVRAVGWRGRAKKKLKSTAVHISAALNKWPTLPSYLSIGAMSKMKMISGSVADGVRTILDARNYSRRVP